ncbi:MAG: polysaccharide biosynthesis tyrosine autokinase [Candidatus Hydrogenedentes bacterium]|nr:polysaccharide biosynthesis tyrosine autokinase [Candidatus Hydrogenedentota bacterium]
MTSEFTGEFSQVFPQAQPKAEALGNLNLKRLLRVRGPQMLLIALVLAVPAMALAWFAVPLEYTASAVIRFSSVTKGVLDEGQVAQRGEYEKFVQTQVNLIRDAVILQRVVEDTRELPLIRKQSDPLQFLKAELQVRVEPGSELVSVGFTSSSRQASLDIVESVLENYRHFATMRKSGEETELRRRLLEEQENLNREYNRQNQRIADMYKALGGPASSSADWDYKSDLVTFNENLAMAKADLTTSEAIIMRIENQIQQIEELKLRFAASPDTPIVEFEIEERVKADARMQALQEQLALAEQALAVAEGSMEAANPRLKKLIDDVGSTRSKIEQTSQELRELELDTATQRFQAMLEEAQSNVGSAQKREQDFAAYIAREEEKQKKIAESLAEIRLEEDKLETTHGTLQRVEQRLYEQEVESRAPANIDVPYSPTAPEKPDYGKRFKLMFMAVFVSMCAGVGYGVGKELMDTEIRTAQDLNHVADAPVMASIPHTSVDRLPDGVNPAMVVANYPDSTTADEYRRILTRIIYPPEGSAEINTCEIVSPSRADGKTSLACNLSIALAQANRRVLLLDISARRPSVEKYFGMEPAEGLSEVFAGEATPHDVVRPTDFPNLFVLGPGFRGKEMIGRLASRDLVEFLENAEQAFEHVIIDTPPALLMADAKLLAPIVDGAIVVIGAERTSKGMVSRCMKEMRQVNANIIGVVLNGVKPTRGGYMAKNLTLYYGYGEEHSDESDFVKGGGEAAQREHGETANDDTPSVILLDDHSENVSPDPETR